MFLRKILPGRSDRSYGIQVARLAGLPPTVVDRAREILSGLEQDELARGGRPTGDRIGPRPVEQLPLFAPRLHGGGARCRSRLRAVDVDRCTPLEALTLLAELKKDMES